MDIQLIEASNGVNYGKFMVARFTAAESQVTSAMPEAPPGSNLFTYAGRRRLNPERSLFVDLQTGEGAEFSLRGGQAEGEWAMRERHPNLWVCPLYRPTLYHLFAINAGEKPVADLPRYIDLLALGLA